VVAKGIRITQGRTASNDLKMLEAMGHRQVQGSWRTKFEVDRTGAKEAKSHSVVEVGMWKCVKQYL
jgi:hypothetical protein